MSNTNQAKVFTKEYIQRIKNQPLARILSLDLNPPENECNTARTSPETGVALECDCKVCSGILNKSLDAAFEDIKSHVSSTNTFPTIGMMVLFLKKFKTIRLGNIFQALSLYKATTEKFDIDTEQKIENLRLSKDEVDKRRYSASLNLHATMLHIFSNYLKSVKSGSKNNYKLTMLKESLLPPYKNREVNINFIKELCEDSSKGDAYESIKLLLTKTLDQFKKTRSSAKKKIRFWNIGDLGSKVDILDLPSLVVLSGIALNYWDDFVDSKLSNHYEDKLRNLKNSLAPMNAERSFLNDLKSNKLDSALFDELENYILDKENSINVKNYDNNSADSIVKYINDWLLENISLIYNEFCDNNIIKHPFILNAYLRHLSNQARLNSRESIDLEEYYDIRYPYLCEAHDIVNTLDNSYLATDNYLKAYINDVMLVSKLYLYKIGTEDVDLNRRWSFKNQGYFEGVIHNHYLVVKRDRHNYVTVHLSLFRLFEIYKYIFFFRKRSDKSYAWPKVGENDRDALLNIVMHYMHEIFKLSEKYEKDSFILGKMLQVHNFLGKKKMYDFWQSYYINKQCLLTKRDLFMFLSLSAKQTESKSNTELERNYFLTGIEHGFFMKPNKYNNRNDLEHAQRVKAETICVMDKAVVIESHNRDPSRSGGAYYATKAVSLMKVMVRYILEIFDLDDNQYNIYKSKLGPVTTKCVDLIRAETRTNKNDPEKDFKIKVITGGKACNYQKIDAAVKNLRPGSMSTSYDNGYLIISL